MEYSTITKTNPIEKENLIKKYLYLVVRALLIGIIGAGIILFASGHKLMIVISGSMEPTLPVGTLVIVTPCDYEDLEIGDIVTMASGGYNFTHRIIGKFNDDPNLTSDQKMSTEYVLTPEDGEAYENAEYWVTMGDADNDGKHDGPLLKDIVGTVEEEHSWTWMGLAVRYIKQNYKMLMIMIVLLGVCAWGMDYVKDKIVEGIEEDYDEDEE